MIEFRRFVARQEISPLANGPEIDALYAAADALDDIIAGRVRSEQFPAQRCAVGPAGSTPKPGPGPRWLPSAKPPAHDPEHPDSGENGQNSHGRVTNG